MKLKTITRSNKYIPEWLGNKDEAPESQIVVNIKRFPGSSEMPNFMTANESIDFKKFLFECVGSITNLEVNDQPIKNGIALSSVYHEEILNLTVELFNYVFPVGEDFTEGE